MHQAQISQAVFDPIKYKRTTLDQWNNAALAWHRWGTLLSRSLGPATETMLDMAGVTHGSRVLDVAAGAGEQTLTAARRVGPAGHVLATDISPVILEYAERSSHLAGLDNVSTHAIDGECLDELHADPFDAVISRVGLIYFPDQQKALRGMRTNLRDGGKVAAMVYSKAECNGFFSVPVSIIRRRAQLPPPLAGQPGPFSLGQPEVLEEALAAGGCTDSMERLAKYHEHISRDLVAASKYCESLPAGAAQEHRRRRIARKIKQQMPLDCVRNPEDSRPDP